MAGRGWLVGRAVAVTVWAAAMLLGAGVAEAAQYTVRACGPAANEQNHLLTPSTSDRRMSAYTACPTEADQRYAGVVARANVNDGTVPFFASAMQTFVAPAGTTIRSARVKADGRTWNGDWTSLLQASTDRFASSVWNLSGCGGNPGSVNGCVSAINTQDRTYDIPGATGIRSVVGCVNFSGCTTFSTDFWPFTRAYYFVHEFDVTLDDLSVPSVSITGGGLFDGRWVHGNQSLVFNITDNSGVRRTRYWVDDLGTIADNDRNCDYTLAVPCSNVTGGQYALDTSTIVDGTHQVAVEGLDATNANLGSNFQTIRIDNHAPTEPRAVAVQGGQGWHTVNSFDLDYTVPGGQIAPVTRAYYQVCKADGTDCSTGSQDGTEISRLANIRVPQPGDYTARVWLMDAAGNVSDAKSPPVHLKFDNVPPAQAQPERRNGWINAVEAKSFREEIGKPTARSLPVSGIAGYAVTHDGSAPGVTPNVAADPSDDYKGEIQLENLPEGTTTVRARAVSGAGIVSEEIGLTDLRVDLSAPEAVVEGVPDANTWSRDPVTARITATDPGQLSGMAGAPALDQDDADGGFIRYAVDGQPLETVRGPAAAPDYHQAAHAAVSIAADGAHTLSFQAVDVAGNGASHGAVSFKIDQTPPELVVFESQQASDPRLITVAASDRTSGLADGGLIQLRRIAPSEGDWQTLRTTREGDRYYAHVANGELPEGDYEFKATIPDQAGNRATGDRNRQGEREVLHISPTQVGPYRTVDDGSIAGGGHDDPDFGATVATRLSAAIVKKAGVLRRKKCRTLKSRTGRKRRKCKTRSVRVPQQLVHEARVPFGKRTPTTGTLTAGDGKPIPRVEIVVLSKHAADGARYSAMASIRTDANGTFKYTVPAGPSRAIDFVYRGDSTYKQADDEVSLAVPASVTLKASRRAVRNGGTVMFTGKLRGRPYPAKGKLLDLQAFYRGKWRTFATPRTGPRGDWKRRYRFQATRGTVLYKFRVRVTASSDYPYDAAYSRLVRVRVTGR
jgi:hypothetical protein